MLPVVLTRHAADNAASAAWLRARGVPVLEWTATATRSLLAGTDAPSLLGRLAAAATVAFTSRRGVDALHEVLPPVWPASLAGKVVLAVGPATARRLEEAGLRARALGGEGAAEIRRAILDGCPQPVLLVRSGTAPPLADALRADGIAVDDLPAHETVPAERPPLPRADYAAIACASPSAVRSFLDAHPWSRDLPFAAIGATTAAALRERGVARVTVADGADDLALARATLAAAGAPAVTP